MFLWVCLTGRLDSHSFSVLHPHTDIPHAFIATALLFLISFLSLAGTKGVPSGSDSLNSGTEQLSDFGQSIFYIMILAEADGRFFSYYAFLLGQLFY